MKYLRKCLLILLMVTLIISFNINSFANNINITEKSISSSMKKILEADLEQEGFNVSVKDSIISVDEESFINYDLKDKPTFWIEIEVTNGIDYDTYLELTAGTIYPMYGFRAIADIAGEDSANVIEYLSKAIPDSLENNIEKYVVEEDESNVKLKEGQIFIKEADFGNYAVEYAKHEYSSEQKITDKGNLFDWTVNKKSESDNSVTIVSTMVVNAEGDFSKISQSEEVEELKLNKTGISLKVGETETITANKLITDWKSSNETVATVNSSGKISAKSAGTAQITATDIDGKIKTVNVTVINTSSQSTSNETKKTSNETKKTSNSNLPKTGISDTILILIAITVFISIIFALQNKKYKNIK